LTITGLPEDLPRGVEHICNILLAHFNRVDLQPYDVENCGLSGFFGENSQKMGVSGDIRSGGMGMNKVFRADNRDPYGSSGMNTINQVGGIFGLHPIQQKMNNRNQPFLQELMVQKNEAMQNYKVLVNLDQMFLILGKGERIFEMQDLSNCKIDIEPDPERTKCMLEVMVRPNNGTQAGNFGSFPGGSSFTTNNNNNNNQATEDWEVSCLRAIWLMNLAVNAYCEGSASYSPVEDHVSLTQLMNSQKYGFPPK